ncbi:hypothetical protein [Amycolatopsis acididurans]|uniref:hypothetical protein n=1 Tax=Amycolatopsis acididurans TaxID=2724524 RepID=UPI0028A7B949|nr:hypothetical protein [Amycolatopsis acididurans]
MLGERAGPRRWIGLVIGLAGVALVVGGDLAGHPGTPVWAYALPFAAMLSLVAATLAERKTPPAPLADSLLVQCLTPATMLLAWPMSGQHLTGRGLLGLLICLAGVALVLLPRKLSVGAGMMGPCSSPTSSPPPRRWRPPAPARARSPRSPSCSPAPGPANCPPSSRS